MRGGAEVSFLFFTISNVYIFHFWHFFYSSKEPEYALFRFTSIKGSGLAATRFWQKNTTRMGGDYFANPEGMTFLLC